MSVKLKLLNGTNLHVTNYAYYNFIFSGMLGNNDIRTLYNMAISIAIVILADTIVRLTFEDERNRYHSRIT